jgi:transforming growth factor-beta-induced protein
MKSMSKMLVIAVAASSLGFAQAAVAGDCGSKSSTGQVMQKTSLTGSAEASQKTPSMNIVQTAVGAGSFKTLVAAVQAAGLAETLQGEGPFTVFAPTDEAFAKLPKVTVEELLKPENKAKLVAILTYHVIPGEVMAEDVVKLKSTRTVQGQNLAIKVADGKVMVDKAQVVQTDILASNGVIHVIDSVVLPL